VAQEPDSDAAGDDPGAVPLPKRVEVVEMQISKLWELFTRAARLDISVEALRDEVRFLTSMWQQIQDNDAVLETTREEVHAVQRGQREKADRRIVRRLLVAGVVAVVALVGGVGVVWWGVRDVRRVAHEECVAANARVQAAITRERALSVTDLPATRAAHRESADAMSRQLRQCG
jgi:hypothetical protein